MGANNNETYVDKQCESCPCPMHHVRKRRRFCGRCLQDRLRARTAEGVQRGVYKRGRKEQEYTLFAAIVDAELQQPTRYWESPC